MQIGKYTVISQLGAGAMGVVYLAEHATLRQRVAIKLINTRLIDGAQISERFLNEARAASKIGHPGIVAIHDFDVDPATKAPYIVMAFLEGQDLGHSLRATGAAPPSSIRDIGCQLADALAAAHAKGIIHRDLKPDNVFLTRDAAVVGGLRATVLDFGIAKLAGNDVTRMTQGGSVMGTPMYMSPEQAEGADRADERSDVYSLGCILYQMASGQVPFPAASDLSELFRLHREVEATPSRELNPHIGEPLSNLIARCMAKRPSDRPSSMTEVGMLLRVVCVDADESAVATGEASASAEHARFAATVPHSPSQEGGGPSPASPLSTQPTTAGAPRALIIGGAFGLLAIGGVALFAIVKGGAAAADKIDAGSPPPEDAPLGSRKNPWIAIAVPAPRVSMPAPEEMPEGLLNLRPALESPERAYELQATEVTWGEFTLWWTTSPHRHESLIVSMQVKAASEDDLSDRPATGMSFATAFAYCESIAGRLPSEAEWEWAARGPALRSDPWSSAEPASLSLYSSSAMFPPVKSAARDVTPTGIYDLAGSAFELTADLVFDPEDSSGLDGYVVIRGANPQSDYDADRRYSAVQRWLLCNRGRCASSQANLAIRTITGFRCAR